ncbi:MAG: hypothetical protein WCZ72_12200 [Gemmobacter sp.]
MSVQDFFSSLLGAVTTINLIWLAVSRVDLAWSGLLPVVALVLVLGLLHIVTRHRFAARDDRSYWRVLRPLLLEDLSHYPNFQQPPGVYHPGASSGAARAGRGDPVASGGTAGAGDLSVLPHRGGDRAMRR